MKKKIVSMVVFVMLSGAARAFAQDGVVDKNVLNVDNGGYAFTCKGDQPNEAVQIQVQNVYSGVKAEIISGFLTVTGGEKLKLNSAYSATAKSDDSYYFKVTTYGLLDDNNVHVGDFSISKSQPMVTRGGPGVFCGRAGCDLQPIKAIHHETYSALLKIYEQEIPFTCQ